MPAVRKGVARKAAPKTTEEVGLEHGFRSGLEDQVSNELQAAGVPFFYEEVVIPYVKPQKPSKYTPDFVILRNGIIVETKGRFVTADRQKHLLVKKQHPDLDIRFVFSRSKSRISKTSTTTYGMWCEKNGFTFADIHVPSAWLAEPPNERSIAAIKALMS